MDREYPVKLWNYNRSQKKTFLTLPSIELLVQKANNFGLNGTKIVLESDGTEICDDNILKYYIEEKSIFLLLEEGQTFVPQFSLNFPSTTTVNNNEIVSFSTLQSTSNLPELQEFIHIPNDIVQNHIIPENSDNINDDTSASAINITLDDTLSVSSSAVSTTSSQSSQSALLFSNFIIPWHKIPSDIMSMLNNKIWLGKRLNCLANILVDELRCISFFIPMSIIRTVSQKVASKYPDSLIQKDKDNIFISSIPMPLITIMKNRNGFLNRSPKRAIADLNADVPVYERKKANVLKETCVNWQPTNVPCGETIDGIESKKNSLQTLHKKEPKTLEDQATINKFMKDCFAVQRKYLNNRKNIPGVQDIKKEWPFLFEKDTIFQHFEELMNIDISNLEQKLSLQKSSIIRFFNATNIKNICEFRKGKIDYSSMDIIKCICLYFNEDYTFLFKVFEFGTTLDSIKEACTTNTPWMGILSNV